MALALTGGEKSSKQDMFQKVLEDEDYTNNLLQRKSSFDQLISSAGTILLYGLFIIGFSVMVLSEPLSECRRLESQLRQHFDPPASSPNMPNISSVQSISTFWTYVENTVLPGIYGSAYVLAKSAKKGSAPTLPKLVPIDEANYLLGVMVLRTVRVKHNVDCHIMDTYSAHFLQCFGEYTSSAEHQLPFGPPSHQFNHEVNPDGSSYSGALATYPPHGYVEKLGNNQSTAAAKIVTLKQFGWIDASNRALFVEFSVWNANMDLYVACRIAFEVTAGGQWVSGFDIDAIPSRYVGLDAGLLIIMGLMALFVLFYIGLEIAEIAIQRLGYFADGWNILDWINLGLVITALTIQFSVVMQVSSLELGKTELADSTAFTNLHPVASWLRLARHINAVNSVIIFLKIVKYASAIPYIETILLTLRNSWSSFVAFAGVFLMSFFGFVLAYRIGFGDKLTSLSTVWKSFFFLMRSFLGSVSIASVVDLAPILGFLLVILFILAIIAIVMNLFSATMIQALTTAHERQRMLAKAGDTEWERVSKRLKEARQELLDWMDFNRKLRGYFPGLYARLKNRKRERKAKEKLRAQQVAERARLSAELNLAAQDPTSGHHHPHKHGRLPLAGPSDDSDSDADLGPLKKAHKKKGKAPPQETLMLQAVQHISRGLMDRANGIRGHVLEEMVDTRHMIQGVSDVVEVLVRRTMDLELQQRQYLAEYEEEEGG